VGLIVGDEVGRDDGRLVRLMVGLMVVGIWLGDVVGGLVVAVTQSQ